MRVRRLAATTAAAVTTLATAATGAVAITTQAHADTKARTSLSIREAKQVIVLGQLNRIAGRLAARGQGPVADATVQLLEKTSRADHWSVVESKATNQQGAVGFLVKPDRTVRFTLAFTGDATHFPTRSGVVTTHVV